jgi:adenine-specific DNA methylase
VETLAVPSTRKRTPRRRTTAIESHAFPFEALSDISEIESWRKEVNRPIYHVHKWWAQRLGSVFRAMILATFAPEQADVLKEFYTRPRTSKRIVFDPFMGSGTTLGEAVKLGFRAIGKDINAVSHFLVRNALAAHSRADVMREFDAFESDTAPHIRKFYRTALPDGTSAESLYYFWVKYVPCPKCGNAVDLFSRYVFSQHAYPQKYPASKSVCPGCGAINTVPFDSTSARCDKCHAKYNPQCGPAHGTKATCPACPHEFPIAKTVKALGTPPAHRMYAKMVLTENGEKQYHAVTPADLDLYATAERELATIRKPYPVVAIEPGYNTNQALNYNYTHWHEMFNARQLLCLSILAARIRKIADAPTRELFACLFSGCLEFNNMFASFKGEGTGAVRHMFSHHILKPERTPLEANLWGTPKSSGSFSTLFRSRILRALDYQESPFELRPVRDGKKIVGEKVFGASHAIEVKIADNFADFTNGKQVYLACGDSAETDIESGSVDAVVTDPPFFDNVHYSQLADFFHVWQRHILGANGSRATGTTRHELEVQQSDPGAFADRLTRVWKECHRVLRDDGLLVFSYHHSRADGWRCVLKALTDAHFVIVATHPIKAEMSVAAPKLQTKEPIDYDIIIVCRKRKSVESLLPFPFATLLRQASTDAKEQLDRLRSRERRISRNDVRVILMAQVIRRLSTQAVTSNDPIREHTAELEASIAALQD